MKFSFITILFALSLSNVFAWEPDTTINPKLLIKTAPLSFIDFFGGLSYRLGTEFKIGKAFSTSLDLGKFFHYQTDNRSGGSARAELKYYYDSNTRSGYFYSAEFLYKNTNFTFDDSFAIPSQPRYEKEYHIHKEISCLTFKWGELEIYKKRLVYEWYIGLGARYYFNSYNDLSADENKYVLTGEGHGDLVGDAIRLVGTHWLPNFNWGFKIGYLIK